MAADYACCAEQNKKMAIHIHSTMETTVDQAVSSPVDPDLAACNRGIHQ